MLSIFEQDFNQFMEPSPYCIQVSWFLILLFPVPIDVTHGIKMLYVFVDIMFDTDHLLRTVEKNFPLSTKRRLAMVSTIQFISTLHVSKTFCILPGLRRFSAGKFCSLALCFRLSEKNSERKAMMSWSLKAIRCRRVKYWAVRHHAWKISAMRCCMLEMDDFIWKPLWLPTLIWKRLNMIPTIRR